MNLSHFANPTDHLFRKHINIPGYILYSYVTGSRLYGCALTNSDTDILSIYVMPSNALLGLSPPSEKRLTKTWKSFYSIPFTTTQVKAEGTAHEVGKFCRLLLKGNPTMVETIFNSETHGASGILWQELIKERRSFLTKQVVKQYLGYINGQLRRLKNSQKLHTGQKGNYNTKWAYHMMRLCWDCKDIVEFQNPTISYRGQFQEELHAIRKGAYSPQEIEDKVTDQLSQIEALKPWNLPDYGPKEWLNKWLLNVRKEYGSLR